GGVRYRERRPSGLLRSRRRVHCSGARSRASARRHAVRMGSFFDLLQHFPTVVKHLLEMTRRIVPGVPGLDVFQGDGLLFSLFHGPLLLMGWPPIYLIHLFKESDAS